jgi:hypothetical protein
VTDDDQECCHSLTETELDSEAVRSAAEDVRRYSQWATRLELLLISVAAIAFVAAAAFAAVSFARLRELAEANRQRSLDAQAGQQFAIDAVNCIRYVLIEHRYVNQEYHDLLLAKFGLPKVSLAAHPDLPRRPSPEEIAMACRGFEAIPVPPIRPIPPTSTTTTRGHG